MLSFTASDRSFQIAGKDVFLLSGEIHYFRIPRTLWARHLKKLKEAHCQAVCTYIPWGWHEPEEGRFDFTGKTHPQTDLLGFIREVEKAGLLLVAKPGPYILAEFLQQGLPEWLIQKHPELICRDAQGKTIEDWILTYMHPTFLSYAGKWFDKVLPLISQNLIDNGGPIAMMQVCNEVGVNQWLSSQGDYSPTSLEYFHRYLKNKFHDVDTLNRILDKPYETFEQVKPPSGICESRQTYVLYRLWHGFHRWYYAVYLDQMIREIRARGITCPLYHNVPGWVYGRAKDFPLNLTMYEEAVRQHPELILGLDHIPENPGYRNFHDDLPCNEIARSMRGGKGPVFAAELQAGSREFCVRTYPDELDLFYRACLAHGLGGMNFYMFSQGENPEKKGHFGPTFYWETALDSRGETQPLYGKIQALGKWLMAHGADLLNTARESQLAAGFYSPLYQTEFTHPIWGNKRLDAARSGLAYDPQAVRDCLFFDGLLKAAQYLNVDIDVQDLQKQPLESLSKYRQLWVVSTDWMDADTQHKCKRYAEAGGHLILMPNVPWMDEYLMPCTILEDALGLRRKVLRRYSCPKIKVLDHEDLYAFADIQTFEPPRKGKVLAKTANGECCGLQIALGKGKISVLGTGLTNVIQEHFSAYKTFFGLDGIRARAWSDEADIRVVQRSSPNATFLFLLNYHKRELKGTVYYTDTKTKKVKALQRGKSVSLAPCSSQVIAI